MEGRPWLRVALIVLGFSLLGWPVWSLTHHATVPTPVAPEVKNSVPEPLRATITFATPPATCAVKALGEVLVESTDPGREVITDWEATVPSEGLDILVKATWPDGTEQTAVRVAITRGAETLADETFWTTDRLVKTVTIPGRTR
jgi:hypothetical protein